MKLSLYALCSVIFLCSCASEQGGIVTATASSSAATGSSGVPPRGVESKSSWTHRHDDDLWQTAVSMDTSFVVGLKTPGEPRGVWRSEILIPDSEVRLAIARLAAMSGVQVVDQDPVLPFVVVRLATADRMKSIRRLPYVDYIEPTQTGPAPTRAGLDGPSISSSDAGSGSGCSNPAAYNSYFSRTPSGDYTSWSFGDRYSGIVAAWNRSQGDNIRIALIDTGIDSEQPQLTSRFNYNASASRQIWYEWVSPSGRTPFWRDDCGHGTRMAGAMAAPMDGQGIVGVAWKSDLISIRTDDDVQMYYSASKVSKAIHSAMAATRPAHVIVLAFFTSDDMSDSDPVADVIRLYYYRTDTSGRRNGPLFIGAAGTSGTDPAYNGNVVFPAEMPEVIAVSGVDQYGQLYPGSHYGPEVEVSSYAPQATTGTPGIHSPSVEVTDIKGSSAGTASIAGIAALIWARFPGYTNVDVRRRLQQAASQYPARDNIRGYGMVNAHRALGGMWYASLSGCGNKMDCKFNYQTAECKEVGFGVTHSGGDGPYTYRWSTGSTSNSTTSTLCPRWGQVETYHVSVTVRDTSDGTSLYRSASIEVIASGEGACPNCPV